MDAICTSRYFRRFGLSAKLLSLILKASIELNYNIALINSYSAKTFPLLNKYYNALYTHPYKGPSVYDEKNKTLLEKINSKGVDIKLKRLARQKSYDTIIVIKSENDELDKKTISLIEKNFNTGIIDSLALECGYRQMIKEIPDENTYFDNYQTINPSLPSFIGDKKEDYDILLLPPPLPDGFFLKYIKYKKKYLELKKII